MIDYNCTLVKMADQIGIQLWQAMEMMKYATMKNIGFSKCMDCGKIIKTIDQSKHLKICPKPHDAVLTEELSK